MNIFDIHVHVYPEKIAKKAAENIGAFYGGASIAGSGTLEDYTARATVAGITRFAIHSVALRPQYVDKINSFMLSAAKDNPQIIPFATMHPLITDVQGTIDSIINSGFRGIKLHPDMQHFALDDESAAPMMEAIEGKLPLLIHCGDTRYDYDGPKRILSLRKQHPRLQIICAHLGGYLEWDEASDILPNNGLMVDTSSSLFLLSPKRAKDMIRKYGTENVLFGTDYPMWNPQDEIQKLNNLQLTSTEMDQILWENAAQLFKL